MKRLVMACVVVGLVLGLSSVSYGEWPVQVWNNLTGDGLWMTGGNWELWDLDIPAPLGVTGAPPTPAEEVTIDPPEAYGYPPAPGPTINPGDAATALGIQTMMPGSPELTMNGGTLAVTEWVWWGDGEGSFPSWYHNGGTVTVAEEFEFGWGGGGGFMRMTGGAFETGRLIIPTGSGAMGVFIFESGGWTVTQEDRFSMAPVGFMDMYDGALLNIADTDGSMVPIIEGYVAAGQILAAGGAPGWYINVTHFPGGKGWAHTSVWAEVPEPATLSLLASLLVLGGVAWLYRRR